MKQLLQASVLPVSASPYMGFPLFLFNAYHKFLAIFLFNAPYKHNNDASKQISPAPWRSSAL